MRTHPSVWCGPSRPRQQGRVIQDQKACAKRRAARPKPESNRACCGFTHKIAEAFLMASFGSVVRVNTDDELPRTARGITADAKGSANYACPLRHAGRRSGVRRVSHGKRAQVEKRRSGRLENDACCQMPGAGDGTVLEAVEAFPRLNTQTRWRSVGAASGPAAASDAAGGSAFFSFWM